MKRAYDDALAADASKDDIIITPNQIRMEDAQRYHERLIESGKKRIEIQENVYSYLETQSEFKISNIMEKIKADILKNVRITDIPITDKTVIKMATSSTTYGFVLKYIDDISKKFVEKGYDFAVWHKKDHFSLVISSYATLPGVKYVGPICSPVTPP
jgi:hypothetical protein